MEQTSLNKAQKEEMKRIGEFFKECTDLISDPIERNMARVKVLSHLACFTDRLTKHLDKPNSETFIPEEE